jgi:hypothetical protein
MEVKRKICENSLRWIINFRRDIHVHNYNMKLIKDDKGDGHTMNSMLWTISQSKIIDKIGLENWIHTEGALGYSDYLTNQDGFNKSSIELSSK